MDVPVPPGLSTDAQLESSSNASFSAVSHARYPNQNELYTVMYPIFVHCYLDFVIRGKVEAGISSMPLCPHVCGHRFAGPSATQRTDGENEE